MARPNGFSRLEFLILLATVFLLSHGVVNSQSRTHGEGETGPKFETVANSVHPLARGRSIYLHLEESDFSEESVSRIFRELDKTFCDPFALTVTIFSDRKMLQWFINGRAADVVNFDYSTKKGKEAAAKYLSVKYPPSIGYFRAHYSRNVRSEYFELSPSLDSSEMRRVIIHDTGTGLKSDKIAAFPKSSCAKRLGTEPVSESR